MSDVTLAGLIARLRALGTDLVFDPANFKLAEEAADAPTAQAERIEGLLKYVCHKIGCPCRVYRTDSPRPECTCGLDAAIDAAKGGDRG